MRRCAKCGKTKPLTEFYKNKNKKEGRSYTCCMCTKAYFKANKEKKKTYRKTHKEKIKAYAKKYKETHKAKPESIDKLTNRQLIRDFNITLEDKRNMYKEQNGRCLICKKKLTERKDCCVDHCHVTGEVRGMLCRKCNYGLGNFNDNPTILRNAINYLKGDVNV